MSITNFTPVVWAASLLENLRPAHVYANCVNRDYDGEIRNFGDTVRINNIGGVTISSYTKGSTALTPQALVGAGQTLNINQAKYFYFAIDDVDKAQNQPSVMAAAMREAAWGIADATDTYLASTVLANAIDSANVLTAQVVGTGAGDADAFEVLVDLRKRLEISNAPRVDRWCVIPPWYEAMLLKDPRFTSFGTQTNMALAVNGPGTNVAGGETPSQLALGSAGNGALARLLGMTVYVSNNVPVSGSAYTVIAGYKGAATYAESIAEGSPEAFRLQTGFQDAVRGLHVYGATVTRPSALASIAVTEAV